MSVSLTKNESRGRPPFRWTSREMKALVDLTDKETICAALEAEPPSLDLRDPLSLSPAVVGPIAAVGFCLSRMPVRRLVSSGLPQHRRKSTPHSVRLLLDHMKQHTRGALRPASILLPIPNS